MNTGLTTKEFGFWFLVGVLEATLFCIALLLTNSSYLLLPISLLLLGILAGFVLRVRSSAAIQRTREELTYLANLNIRAAVAAAEKAEAATKELVASRAEKPDVSQH